MYQTPQAIIKRASSVVLPIAPNVFYSLRIINDYIHKHTRQRAASQQYNWGDIICQLKYNCFFCPSHSLTLTHFTLLRLKYRSTTTITTTAITLRTVQNLPKLNFPLQHFLISRYWHAIYICLCWLFFGKIHICFINLSVWLQRTAIVACDFCWCCFCYCYCYSRSRSLSPPHTPPDIHSVV